jgi:uncharacterized protein YeaO (DUF488 family)
MPPDIRVRRVYEKPAPEDGMRVLVDRIWPRGLRKDALRLDEWARDLAPSTGLRTWYGHDPAKFGEFRRRYQAELAQPGPAAALVRLAERARAGPVTLLTATRDAAHSQAAVLAEMLRSSPGEQAGDPDPGSGGEPACYAHLVCAECGSMTTEGHRPGCSLDPAAAGTERS